MGLGQKLSKEIPPYSYWNMQFYQSEAAYVRFDYNIPRGASIGVYARRNALPTHTQYDLLEVLSGFKARTTRASHVSVIVCATAPFLFFFLCPRTYNDIGSCSRSIFLSHGRLKSCCQFFLFTFLPSSTRRVAKREIR